MPKIDLLAAPNLLQTHRLRPCWTVAGSQGCDITKTKAENAKAECFWVSGKKVKAKRSDGALVFKSGKITCTIQGDRRLKGEDRWTDSDAGTQGLIVPE